MIIELGFSGKITIELGIHTPATWFFNHFAKQLDHVQNITCTINEVNVHHGHDWYAHDIVKQ
ncbi:hypothetical protein TanjilG_14011 [Lupinus angustifolius]|uniref:Bet v I/Major latex protein domain-containing protein n=1 Tax=Lupinus angustifolius TaxID=3871 RepID=A0A1J7GNH4_LUPAN|nr:hypothetical protein TanjilG_14011 [Lupinus angustifolius]